MKKLMMAIVCLMTMVLSVNAQKSLYGIWDSTDSKITIEINDDHIKITENNESLVLFRENGEGKSKGYKEFYKNHIVYYCMFKLPGVGTKKINVLDEYDIFDANHITMKLRFTSFNDFDLDKTYRMVKRQ